MNVEDLSLREQAAQLVFPRLGSNMPPPVTAAEDIERFERLLEACPVGGLILFNGSFPRTTDALSRIQRKTSIPLLVAADMERGVGQQIRGATVFPHAMAFAAAGEVGEGLLESAARVQAREALGCGIQITFSPVADVNRDPRNPIIATRAFGSDPNQSAQLARAFIRGCKAEGLLTTAKHFPGHGNTSKDSHSELPLVESSREELEAFDLVPFRAAIEEGVDLVMTAHVLFPALDPDRPSTFSRRILRDLLRGELGFDGVVVTDSLLMGAIRNVHADAGARAAALVDAGVDILLDVSDPEKSVEGIVRAVENGALNGTDVERAAGRVLKLKSKLMARFGGGLFASPASLFGDEIGSERNRSLAEEASQRAVTVMGSTNGVLPIDAASASRDGLLAVLIKPHSSRLDDPEEPFGAAVRSTFPGAEYRQLGPDADASMLDEVRKLASGSKFVVLALVVKPSAWHAFGLRPEQAELVADLTRRGKAILVSLGSPNILESYGDARARVCVYSDVAASQRAAVELLVGRVRTGLSCGGSAVEGTSFTN